MTGARMSERDRNDRETRKELPRYQQVAPVKRLENKQEYNETKKKKRKLEFEVLSEAWVENLVPPMAPRSRRWGLEVSGGQGRNQNLTRMS